jgi:hypothetical protein
MKQKPLRLSNPGSSAGVSLAAGGTSWGAISDLRAKKNFRVADPAAVLEKLAGVSITRWNYEWEADDASPHLGPVAQDFKAAFYPGRDDTTITTLEYDGVALMAIQGLNQKLEQHLKRRDAEISALKRELAEVKAMLNELSKPNQPAGQ